MTWTKNLFFQVLACCCFKAAASSGDQEPQDSHAVQPKPGCAGQTYCKQTKQKFCFTKLLSSKQKGRPKHLIMMLLHLSRLHNSIGGRLLVQPLFQPQHRPGLGILQSSQCLPHLLRSQIDIRAVSVDYSEQLNTESLSSLNNQVRPNSTSVRDLIYMPSKEVLKQAGTDKGRVVISDRSMYKPEPPVDGMTLVVSNLPDLAGVSATTALSSGVTNIAAPSSTAGSRPGYTM
ncbi:hypothetical protein WJX77_008961 [Trebouxia sp. C0004]